MKLSQKKKFQRLLAATLAATTLTWCGGVVQAEKITVTEPDESGASIGFGSVTTSEDISGNEVEVNGGSYDFRGMFSAVSMGNARNNRLIINNGRFGGVSGGISIYYIGDTATARLIREVSGNRVEIYGGTIGNVSGGEVSFASLANNSSELNFSNFTGNASYNSVFINGGSISNGVTGGGALSGSADFNTVELRGGRISGDVIGGVVRYPSADSTATGNVINIYGSIGSGTSNANLIGGMIDGSPYYTGNTLNIYGSGITAREIDGFDKINFNLDDSNLSGNFAMRNTFTNIRGSLAQAVDVYADPLSNITTGVNLNLLNSSGGINFSGGIGDLSDKVMNKGAYEAYKIDTLNSDGTNLTVTVGEQIDSPNPVLAAPQAPISPEIINYFDKEDPFEEGDLADEVKEVHEQHGFEIFLNAGAYRLKTKTGRNTWIRNSAGNYDVGFARSFDMGSGTLYIAPVLEHGNGKFDAYLGKGRLWGQEVYGHGNNKYTAGGIIARKVNNSGFYVEASARGGKSESSFYSNDYAFGGKQGIPDSYSLGRVSYNVDAPVFIGHVRVGQAKRLNKDNLLDVYGLAFYSRQWDSDTNVHNSYAPNEPDHLDFGATNTARFRFGYRLTTRTSLISRIYTGLLYQYDYNSGTVTIANDGTRLSSDGSNGSSGMLELGWQIKPNRSNPWLVDINAQGWLGYQHGGSLMAKMKKSF